MVACHYAAPVVLSQLYTVSALQSFLHIGRPCFGINLQFSVTPSILPVTSGTYLPRTLVLMKEEELREDETKVKRENDTALGRGMSREHINSLLARPNVDKQLKMQKFSPNHPVIVSPSRSNNDSVIHYLQARLLLDENSLRRMDLAGPNLCHMSIKDNIETKLDWLQMKLLLDDNALRGIILSYPAILYKSANSIIENLDWLQHHLNLVDAALRKAISSGIFHL